MNYLNTKHICDQFNADFKQAAHEQYGETLPKYKLLEKTHWDTGYHYLCVTHKEDPWSYPGSGIKWSKITKCKTSESLTEILYASNNLEEFNNFASKLSDTLNVVEDENWANLIPERGFTYSPEAQSAYIKKSHNEGTHNTIITNYSNKTGLHNPMADPEIKLKCKISREKTMMERYGVKNCWSIPEVIVKSQAKKKETNLSRYGVENYSQIEGKGQEIKEKREATLLAKCGHKNISSSYSPERRKEVNKAISDARRNASPEKKLINSKNMKEAQSKVPRVACIHCGIVTTPGNLKRWHNDNCKKKDI